MTNDLLDYPERHYGMDHDRYEWSMLQDREPVTWPGGKPLALWINISCSTSRYRETSPRSRHRAH